MDSKSESMRGYLYKWTNYLKGYQKRWFILENGLVSYYRNQAEIAHTCRGTINLANATINSTGSTTFLISNSSTQTFHLKAASEAEQKKWVSALISAKNKALAFRRGYESDVYLEGDEDEDEYKSCLSADEAMRLINQTLTNMEARLTDLQRHQDTLSRKGDDLQRAVADLEVTHDPSELVQRFALARERSTVYRVASLAMVNSCAEFTNFGRNQTQRWRHMFNSQRERCAQLEQMIEELAKQLRQLELMVRQNNPQAANTLAGFGGGTTSAVGGPDKLLSSHGPSLPPNIPGQAVRVDRLPKLCIRPKITAPNSQSVTTTPEITVPATSDKVLDGGIQQQTAMPVVTKERLNSFPSATPEGESSDEDFYDAEEASSQFSVYLPPTSAEISSQDTQTLTSSSPTISRACGTQSKNRNSTGHEWNTSQDEDSTIPAGTDVAFEYESDVDLSDGDDMDAMNHQKSTKLREACVIQPWSRKRKRRSATDKDASTHAALEKNNESNVGSEIVFVPKRHPAPLRRTSIPFRPNYSLNLWSIMKNCIGKELTKIPMPVNFSEPLSMLQRLTEDFEYSSLLDKAARCRDSLEQIVHVAAFTISSYASTAIRVNKPFNPLLGETYECDRTDDMGWRSVAEQVSHHPPKCALHCESNGWYCWLEFSMSTKFRGKYLQIFPIGTVHLVFRSTGHHYSWQKIPLTVHNIIVGRLWIDNSGEMDIVNHNTGEKCHLSYKAYSYFSSETPRRVTGAVTDKSGAVRYILNGTWDSSMEYAPVVSSKIGRNGKPVLETGQARIIWERGPLPPDADKMYYFTALTIQLNEEEPGVCPTDCRFRPDQRLMEEGRWDEANRAKVTLEEKQRHRRRQMAVQMATESLGLNSNLGNGRSTSVLFDAERGSITSNSLPANLSALTPAYIGSFLDRVDDAHKPLWFERKVDVDTGTPTFEFNNKYWECKAKQDWSMCPDIY